MRIIIFHMLGQNVADKQMSYIRRREQQMKRQIEYTDNDTHIGFSQSTIGQPSVANTKNKHRFPRAKKKFLCDRQIKKKIAMITINLELTDVNFHFVVVAGIRINKEKDDKKAPQSGTNKLLILSFCNDSGILFLRFRFG